MPRNGVTFFALTVCVTLTLCSLCRAGDVFPRRADGSDPRFPVGTEVTPQVNHGPETAVEREVEKIKTVPWNSMFQKESELKPGIVSVQELEHPISDPDRKRLRQAEQKFEKGKWKDGMKSLEAALEKPATAGYAEAILGTEYLKQNELALAVKYLTESAQMLPGSVAVHSNLGYALSAGGHVEDGEQELRKALALDPDSYSSHYLLGLILLSRTSSTPEAYQQLKAAENKIDNAHLALAVMNARDGRADSMQHQLDLYAVNKTIDKNGLKKWVLSTAALPDPASAFGLGRNEFSGTDQLENP
jgi:tetratricopeptide (TPR) repeat protein